jgi:hypothetical protein
MPRVSAVPYSQMDSELKAIVHASDEALGGSIFQAERRPLLCTSEWQ